MYSKKGFKNIPSGAFVAASPMPLHRSWSAEAPDAANSFPAECPEDLEPLEKELAITGTL